MLTGLPQPGGVDTRALAKSIRIHALKMTSAGGSAHVGAVFSMADIVAVLYGGVLRVDPNAPQWPDRDRFILSKGHAGAGVYAALAERGFFPQDRLSQHYRDGSVFSGHMDYRWAPEWRTVQNSTRRGTGFSCC